MKRRSINITAFLMILIGALAATSVVHAAGGPSVLGSVTKLFGLDIAGFYAESIATLMNWAMTGMSFILAIAGSMFNFSIQLTMQIKDFVGSTPAVYSTWRAIRDISSLFIIFFLLYAAIQLILSRNAGFGSLIKNIVIAGVLINFSFFFAGLGIDASNIVSVQLYNAIAPANQYNIGAADASLSTGIKETLSDGGLSSIFMKSFKITDVYKAGVTTDSNGQKTSSAGAPVKIFVSGLVGVMVELCAAISFAAASLAFIVRFVILILLLAFSPIWFAAQIVPDIQAYSKKWVDNYKAMLIFMPAYLLLMYLAMNVLTTAPLLTNATGTADTWYGGLIVMGVNAAIVITLINMPLIGAISLAGESVKFINTKKLGAGAMWSKLRTYGSQGAQSAWKNTGGRAASKITQSEGFKDFAARRSVIGGLALKGARATSAEYDAKLASQIKSRTDFAESLGYDQSKVNRVNASLAAGTINKKQARTLTDRIKYARKEAYSKEIDTRSIETLYLYKARKNKVTAAKMQLDVSETILKDKQDALKETNAEIKQLQKAIDASDTGGTAAQQTDMTNLRTSQAAQQTEVNDLIKTSGEKKLIK